MSLMAGHLAGFLHLPEEKLANRKVIPITSIKEETGTKLVA